MAFPQLKIDRVYRVVGSRGWISGDVQYRVEYRVMVFGDIAEIVTHQRSLTADAGVEVGEGGHYDRTDVERFKPGEWELDDHACRSFGSWAGQCIQQVAQHA